MANMSYCRFENTLRDLQDCQEALQQGDFSEMNNTEKLSMKKLIEVCGDIHADFNEEE